MEEQIFEARIRLLLQQWPINWSNNLGVQALCAYVVWPYHSPQIIISWCSANLLIFFYRLYMWRNFNRYVQQGEKGVRRWARYFVISTIPGGLVWGAAAWLFFDPLHPQITVFMMVVMMGMNSGALPSFSSYSPAYIAFSSSIMLPMAAKLAIMDWGYSGWLAVLSMSFLISALIYTRNLDRTISKSITLDLRNQQLLEEVTRARDMEHQANAQKSHFLASVSHDLRQPLYAMGLFLESLTSIINTPEQKEVLAHASQSRDDLDDMFDAILEVSYLETGSIQPLVKSIKLQPLIDSLLNNFSVHAKKKKLQLDCDECDAVVKTDPVLLLRILNNLLSNAIKYTEQGSIKIVCKKIVNNNADEQLEIKICDTGCGITESQQSIIFNEYQQLNNPERDKNKGLGLGLSVVSKISHLLNYPVSVNSIPGKGSEFSVLLPMGDAELAEHAKFTSTVHDFSDLHILLIEDNTQVRKATRDLLQQWGYKVSAHTSEEEALEALQDHSHRAPDLVICDYRLADDKNGAEAIIAVRNAVDKKLPAIIITADTSPEIKTEITELGYFMIKKPVRPAYLKNVINEMLG